MYFKDNKSEAGHGRQSLRGGAISLVARAVNAAIQIGSVLFLARLLSPEDYGLVSMVAAITGIGPTIVDLGTRYAIVQRPQITEGEISALFWLTMAVGGGCALLVAAFSPLLAASYGEPRLSSIALVSALTFITSALSCQHGALLRRAMKFQGLGVIEVAANLISAAAAVAMALCGFDYWALVLRPLVMSSLLALGVWLRCRWLPGRPTVTPAVKQMVMFGLHIGGFAITDFMGRSSDRIAIGYSSGARALGYCLRQRTRYPGLSSARGRDGEPQQGAGQSAGTAQAMGESALHLGLLLHACLRPSRRDRSGPDRPVARRQVGVCRILIEHHCLARDSAQHRAHAGMAACERGQDRSVEPLGRVLRCRAGGSHVAGLPFGPEGIAVAYVLSMFILFIPAIAYAGSWLGSVRMSSKQYGVRLWAL